MNASRPFVVALLAMSIASCGAGADRDDSPLFDDLVEQAVVIAEERGASSEQLEILQRAKSDGQLEIEPVREAAHAAVDCMVVVGLDARYEETTYNGDLVFPGYSVRSSEALTDAPTALIDSCEDQYLVAVQWLYSNQPSWVEARDAYVLARESELRACLEESGISTDPDADGIELAVVAFEYVGTPLAGGSNCLEQAEIDTFG